MKNPLFKTKHYFQLSLALLLSVVFVAFAAPPSTPKENLFKVQGDVIENPVDAEGALVINGVHILKNDTHIVADTVAINGSIVTHQHNLTIVARTIIFSQRPNGVVLRPFEIFNNVSEEEKRTNFAPLLLELKKTNSLLPYPLSENVPHICSTTGMRTPRAEKYEKTISPGKIKIIAGRIVGKPFIYNSKDPYFRNAQAVQKHFKLINHGIIEGGIGFNALNDPLYSKFYIPNYRNDGLGTITSNGFAGYGGLYVDENGKIQNHNIRTPTPEETTIKDDYSEVKIIYGEIEENYRSNLFDPIKQSIQSHQKDKTDDISKWYLKMPDFIYKYHNSAWTDPKTKAEYQVKTEFEKIPINPHFFYVIIGSDHFAALAAGIQRFEAEQKLRMLYSWNKGLLIEIQKVVKLMQAEEATDDKKVKIELANQIQKKLAAVREEALKSQKLVETWAKEADPELAAEISKIFIPENIDQPDFAKELQKSKDRWLTYIPLYRNSWRMGDPMIPFDQWAETYK